MLLLENNSALEGCCAATILLYPAPLDRMLGEVILMLVLENKFCLGRLLRSNCSIISGPTGQDARGGGPNASSGQDARGWDLSGYSLITARMHLRFSE